MGFSNRLSSSIFNPKNAEQNNDIDMSNIFIVKRYAVSYRRYGAAACLLPSLSKEFIHSKHNNCVRN